MYDKSYSVQIIVDIDQPPVTLEGKNSRAELLEERPAFVCPFGNEDDHGRQMAI